MFEQAFRNIDDVLRKEAGCTTELDYTKLFPYLHGLPRQFAPPLQGVEII